MQTITRQVQWATEGEHVVEVSSGGIDYANPDALCKKYPGEFDEFEDPVECMDTAIEIAKKWQLDEPNELIQIGTGYTHGMTMPFEGEPVRLTPDLIEEKVQEYMQAPPSGMPQGFVRKWAEKAVAKDYPDNWNEPLFKALRQAAQERLDALPKCDHCGKPIFGSPITLSEYGPDWQFDREFCAEQWYIEQEEANQAEDDTEDEDQ